MEINLNPYSGQPKIQDIAKKYGSSLLQTILMGNPMPLATKIIEKEPDYKYHFGQTDNKFKEFADVMTPIFKEVLIENNLPTNNLNNLVRQAALESNYGLDPRGEQKYNLSGIKHPGQKIAPKYKSTKYKDGFDYFDFDNLKDYANYKVKLLNNRYGALEAKNTDEFINKLHGDNKHKSNYSADVDSYRRNLNNTTSLNKYLVQ